MNQRAALPSFEDTTSLPQRIWGLIYLPLHIVVLPLFLSMLQFYVPGVLNELTANVVYYGLGFLFCLILMWKYLRSAYDKLCDNKILNAAAFISAYVAYFILSLVASLVLMAVMGDELLNPNNEAVDQLAQNNARMVMALSVFLAPVVEEILFRGVLFGSLRKKSRAAAYIVSILVFGFYHVWQYALVYMDWRLLIYAIQYIAPGYALCWLYERTSCIWLPIFMHMAINLTALLLM